MQIIVILSGIENSHSLNQNSLQSLCEYTDSGGDSCLQRGETSDNSCLSGHEAVKEDGNLGPQG
jgi:hypothetical protein